MKKLSLLFCIASCVAMCATTVSWAHGPAPDCAVLLKMTDKEAYDRGPVLEAVRKQCALASLRNQARKEEAESEAVEKESAAPSNVESYRSPIQ